MVELINPRIDSLKCSKLLTYLRHKNEENMNIQNKKWEWGNKHRYRRKI